MNLKNKKPKDFFYKMYKEQSRLKKVKSIQKFIEV